MIAAGAMYSILNRLWAAQQKNRRSVPDCGKAIFPTLNLMALGTTHPSIQEVSADLSPGIKRDTDHLLLPTAEIKD